MRIKLTDHFRGKKPGDVIDWPDPMASILIDAGRAVKHEAPEGEDHVKAVDGPPVDKSMQRRVLAKKKG